MLKFFKNTIEWMRFLFWFFFRGGHLGGQGIDISELDDMPIGPGIDDFHAVAQEMAPPGMDGRVFLHQATTAEMEHIYDEAVRRFNEAKDKSLNDEH